MKQALLLLAVVTSCSQLFGQKIASFNLESVPLSPRPKSNSVNDLIVRMDTLWTGTGKGLSYTNDAGRYWTDFSNIQTFQERGVSALDVRNDEIWVATAYSEDRDGESISIGGGLHHSSDRGKTWRFIKQPVDSGTVDTLIYGRNRIAALAVTVPENNVTYDLAITKGAVWIASFAGMLRKSTDRGTSWQRVILPPDGSIQGIKPSDTLNFDLSPSSGKLGLRENLNHRVFAVFTSDDSTIWVGTANGINKSTDGGVSWRKFNHQNQSKPISGNFVVAINEQRVRGRRIVWAATVNALDQDEKRGVSFSTDGGESWQATLLGEFPHNISFQDSIVYVASDGGLLRSSDSGTTWIRSGTIYDPTTLQRFGNPLVYSVAVHGDTVWCGTSEGLAMTIDSPFEPFGNSWRIFRTYEPVGASNKTYSYPLPFSPDDEVVRIHYGTQGKTVPVTIRIFDFAMQPVRTLIQGARRSGSMEHDEIWNGTDQSNRRVANGVYFYRIEIEGNDPLWGKIFVLQ